MRKGSRQFERMAAEHGYTQHTAEEKLLKGFGRHPDQVARRRLEELEREVEDLKRRVDREPPSGS